MVAGIFLGKSLEGHHQVIIIVRNKVNNTQAGVQLGTQRSHCASVRNQASLLQSLWRLEVRFVHA